MDGGASAWAGVLVGLASLAALGRLGTHALARRNLLAVAVALGAARDRRGAFRGRMGKHHLDLRLTGGQVVVALPGLAPADLSFVAFDATTAPAGVHGEYAVQVEDRTFTVLLPHAGAAMRVARLLQRAVPPYQGPVTELWAGEGAVGLRLPPYPLAPDEVAEVRGLLQRLAGAVEADRPPG